MAAMRGKRRNLQKVACSYLHGRKSAFAGSGREGGREWAQPKNSPSRSRLSLSLSLCSLSLPLPPLLVPSSLVHLLILAMMRELFLRAKEGRGDRQRREHGGVEQSNL